MRNHMYDYEMCCCKAIFASSTFSMAEAVEAVEARVERTPQGAMSSHLHRLLVSSLVFSLAESGTER